MTFVKTYSGGESTCNKASSQCSCSAATLRLRHFIAARFIHHNRFLLVAMMNGLLVFSLSSCANQTAINLPIFEKSYWQEAEPSQQTSAEVNHKWWEDFADAKLNELVEKAKKQSHDAKIALARIDAARAAEESTIAAQFPVFSIGGDLGRTKTSQNLTSRPNIRKYSNNYKAGFDASWEVNPSALEPALRAADANKALAQQNYNGVLVTLAGEVARYYFEIRKNQELLKLAKNNAQIQQDFVNLTSQLAKAGKVSGADVAAAETSRAQINAQIMPLNMQITENIYRLETLLGVPSGALQSDFANDSAIKYDAESSYALAAPLSVLASRPDVLAAQANVEIAAALKDVAFAQYYPSINIAAFFGLESGSVNNFLKTKSNAISLTGGLAAPIFDFGKIKADVAEKTAGIDEAVANYEKTVMAAISEVEIGVNAVAGEKEHYQRLLAAHEAAADSFDLANKRYKAGLTGYLNVIDAQKNVNATAEQMLVSKANVLLAQVRLYKALGGGWK